MAQQQTVQQTNAQSGQDDQDGQASLIYGPSTPPLWRKTLAELVKEQAAKYGNREAVLVPWQSAALSYAKLTERSALVSKALLDSGIRHGECVGIMAGNCYEYIEIFLGAGRIGSPAAVFNNTFSPQELDKMVSHTGQFINNHLSDPHRIQSGLINHSEGCKVLFIAPEIGRRNLAGHVRAMIHTLRSKSSIRHIVLLGERASHEYGANVRSYTDFLHCARSIFINDSTLARAERRVASSDVVNLQFTSGKLHGP